MNKAIVLKKQANLFSVELETGDVCDFLARKNLKKDGVFVGDFVEIDDSNAIFKVEKRKNLLIRPPVANVDKMFIVVAPIPKADFYTIDKLLLFCKLNDIEPVVCINKSDLDLQFCENSKKIYERIAKTLIFSTKNDSFEVLKDEIKGLCVLAGQSAVGKSSIINALQSKNVAKVDTFSKKVERGKQTTRTVELYKFGKCDFLADTAGFSKLDESLLDLDFDKVKDYYPEFLEFAPNCKYKSCLHINCKDCGVLDALEKGKIQKIRHENYQKLVETLKMLKKF